MAEPTVRVSGIVLSSLMFQHVNSDSDVEGLILGESRSEEQITISDSQADLIHIEEIYNIQKHISCHRLNDFYNSSGDVNMDAVKKLLAGNKLEDIIGWYRQRRNSEQQMSFREKLLHEKLKTSLSNPHMMFLLLTPCCSSAPASSPPASSPPGSSPPASTCRTEYSAFISRSGSFLSVPVLVSNLGLLDQQVYWRTAAACSASGYDVTMRKHSSRFFSSNGLLREVNDMNAMNECLQSELQEACREVVKSEHLVEKLQTEVSALRRKLKEKKRKSGAGKDDGPVEQNQLLLQEAVRVLFSCSPLVHIHTLTLDGFPVPQVSTTTLTNSQTDAQETLSVLRPDKKRKRRKSPS